VVREVIEGGVRLSAGKAWFAFYRLRPGVVLVCAGGADRDDLGWAPMDELREDLVRFGPVELFIDGSDVNAVTTASSDKWTEWLAGNRERIQRCNMLVRSKFMQITVEVSRFFSRTDDMVRIYLDEAAFEEAITRAAPGFKGLPGRRTTERD
jgi:hypothetical protein